MNSPETLLETWEKRKMASSSFTLCIEKPVKGSYNKNFKMEESLQDVHLMSRLDKKKTYFISVQD